MTSLNTGTVSLDWKLKTRGREGVVVGGRVKMSEHDCLIRPQDIELKTIKSMVVTPMMGSTNLVGSYVGYKMVVLETYIGSVGVLDSSRAAGTPGGNYVRLRAAGIGSYDLALGTTRVGSALPGSLNVSFIAYGE